MFAECPVVPCFGRSADSTRHSFLFFFVFVSGTFPHGVFDVFVFEFVSKIQQTFGPYFLSTEHDPCSFVAENPSDGEFGHWQGGGAMEGVAKGRGEVLIGGILGSDDVQRTFDGFVFQRPSDDAAHIVHVHPRQPLFPRPQGTPEPEVEWPVTVRHYAPCASHYHSQSHCHVTHRNLGRQLRGFLPSTTQSREEIQWIVPARTVLRVFCRFTWRIIT